MASNTFGGLLLLVSVLQHASASPHKATAMVNKSTTPWTWYIQDNIINSDGCKYSPLHAQSTICAVAYGTFADTLNKTGWGTLNIRTNGTSNTDAEQHYGAGFLEGVLTANGIYDNYLNTMAFTFKNGVVPPAVETFMNDQYAWSVAQVKANQDNTFWQVSGAILAQFDGLVAGYAYASAQEGGPPPLPIFAFQLLNGVGDLFQIIPAVVKDQRDDFASMTKAQRRKIYGALEDLLMGHSSWFEYGATNRIFKYYTFDWHANAAAKTVSFSSYPGYLESLDDFYMTSAGIGWTQTSNGIPNATLLDLVSPNSLLAWQRVRAASALADSGQQWYQAFRTAASGTYVNQYMIVDFKLFTPGQALLPGTLWVIEEIPGLVEGADQTPTLARGSYWPSYNVPYYAEVYRRSGYTAAFDVDEANFAAALQGKAAGAAGPFYDGGGSEWQVGAPRSKLMRRDHGKVQDMISYKEFLRYANYSDPYAINPTTGQVDFGAAICMRGDLANNGTGSAGGCYDTKVTSYLHGIMTLEADIVNGPSSSASSPSSANPPFAWRAQDSALHAGLPAVYDFPFVHTQPAQMGP